MNNPTKFKAPQIYSKQCRVTWHKAPFINPSNAIILDGHAVGKCSSVLNSTVAKLWEILAQIS